jgi:hypothetical protein
MITMQSDKIYLYFAIIIIACDRSVRMAESIQVRIELEAKLLAEKMAAAERPSISLAKYISRLIYVAYKEQNAKSSHLLEADVRAENGCELKCGSMES